VPSKAGNQAESLPAEMFMTAVKMVSMTVEAAIGEAAIVAGQGNRTALAAKMPVPRNPVAVSHVAGCPEVSRSWAGRNVSHRSAHINPKFGCLRPCRTNGRNASHHRCTQHPIAHAAHNPYLLPGYEMCEPGPASSRLGLVSCCPSGVPVMY
jgi:hypothetical protein